MKRLLALLLCLLHPPSWAESAAAGSGQAQHSAVFDVMEYDVAGNTVLPKLAIERAVSPYLGPDKTIADVDQARAALERAYHQAGYNTVYVDIPEQSVSDGIVVLRVTEGRVETVRVTGSRYYSQGRILAQVPEFAPGKVPYFPAVQEELAAVNRTPGRQVLPVLKPGAAPGTLDVNLAVNDQLPLHGSLELNNYYSPNTRPLRLSSSLEYDNLWQREHRLSLQFQTSPQDTSQVRTYSLSYVIPFVQGRDNLALYYLRSDSNVGALGGITVLGRGDIFGARYILPLPPKGNYTHGLSLGADYKRFTQNIVLPGAPPVDTPITYLPLSVQYSGAYKDGGGTTQLGLGLSFAIRGGVDKNVDCYGQTVNQFECNRYGAKSNYMVLKPSLTRMQNLPAGFTLRAGIDGQIASGPLVSNEQFSAGGAGSVRGYLASEALGDDGVHAVLELSSPSLADKATHLDSLVLLAFLEGAHVRLRQPLASQQPDTSLASSGLGLRMAALKGMDLGADVAWPMISTAYTRAGRPRVDFRWAYQF